jgi:transketolase
MTTVSEPSRADTSAETPELDDVTRAIREHIVNMCGGPSGGHLGGSMSLVEVLTALYFRVMRCNPSQPADPDRDVLVLSKGHGGLALYATLAEAGFFSASLLETYGQPGSELMSHPHPEIPGVEVPSGSLGHGLAVGLGFALAHRLDGRGDRRTFVVMGDGEMQEGSVWEAASVAAHQGVDTLTAIVDRNRLQITGGTEAVCSIEPLADRWRAFGWEVHEVDGHDLEALVAVLDASPEPGRPTAVIAHTVKGKGVAPVEGKTKSHFARLSPRQRKRTLAMMSRDGGDDT